MWPSWLNVYGVTILNDRLAYPNGEGLGPGVYSVADMKEKGAWDRHGRLYEDGKTDIYTGDEFHLDSTDEIRGDRIFFYGFALKWRAWGPTPIYEHLGENERSDFRAGDPRSSN